MLSNADNILSEELVKQVKLRVLVMREGEYYIAQCIEHDIAAQSRTIEGLRREFERVFLATFERYRQAGKDMFKEVPAAPRAFAAAYEREEVKEKFPKLTFDNIGVVPSARVVAGHIAAY